MRRAARPSSGPAAAPIVTPAPEAKDDARLVLAGGQSFATQFGTFYAPNITTDLVAGIGDWSLEDFATAVRNGISPDGEPYYPVFPYIFYTRLTDQDVADLYAAFRTVAPVSEPAPASDVPFPFSERYMLKLWRALFMDAGEFDADSARSDAWNRGKYLVEGPLHCGALPHPAQRFRCAGPRPSLRGKQRASRR